MTESQIAAEIDKLIRWLVGRRDKNVYTTANILKNKAMRLAWKQYSSERAEMMKQYENQTQH